MKLYYVIDVAGFKVVSTHRSRDAADNAADSQRKLEVRASDCEDKFLVYTFYKPDTTSHSDIYFYDVLPADFTAFSFVVPDYHSVAVDKLNRRLNRIIKDYGVVVDINRTLNFLDVIESVKDEYLKSSVEPDLKGQPFTHHSITTNGWNDPSIAYHVVIDLSNC